MRLWQTLPFTLLVLPLSAQAHSPFDGSEPAYMLSGLLLLFLWVSYLVGARRVPASRRHWWLFQATCVVTVLTVFGPLDDWAEVNTAAHMTQHMLMMVVIAPLWVMAQPLPQLGAVFPRLVQALAWPMLRCAQMPMFAAIVHAVVIWFWHAPKLYVLALENPWWHAVEHLCFIVTAGILWWSVLRCSWRAAPRALLALFFTLMHTGFLGALLTFAPEPLYGADRVLVHQQLAGLLMWVMGGLPYFAAVIWICWRWFQRAMRPARNAPMHDF